ncbi:ATP-binding protein [Rhizobium sp. 18055]|uniref:ATP-binding protein n=1 Tax=Rhizobium sp. 18055 TaxID=2681403 RepID=UPI00135AFFA7|nr:ATP-binding protein [Rhizobium sp. 18055]
MTSLRMRIAVLLILSIAAVVGLATLAAMLALQPPSQDGNLQATISEIRTLMKVASLDRQTVADVGVQVDPKPASGQLDNGESEHLTNAARVAGLDTDIRVTPGPQSLEVTASIRLPDGRWLVTVLPSNRPPPGGAYVFAGWIFLILIGSAVVSLFAATKITMPLRIIDNAVSSVGPNGELGLVPEIGPAEVRATAQALNRLSRHLKVAIESRMRLVAAAGHDLRTPMTRMRLRAEFITDDEERSKWLSDLNELDQIADSAISLVREEVNQDTLEAVSLDLLIREIVTSVQQAGYAAETGLLKRATVRAGPIALRRALTNLIVNAATHGDGARVSVTANGMSAIVTVEDDGPGIPEDLMVHVFEPFFRVDAARRKTFPGAGLGMAIAREIIARFSGTVELTNRRPNGLLQTIIVPLAI